MSFEYKSSNFLSTPTPTDNRLRIYDKNGKLKYSIEIKTAYYYLSGNCVIIKITNENDIKLTFENNDDALIAMKKLIKIKGLTINKISGDVFYIGNWRMMEKDGKLIIEKKVNDNWVFGGEFT